MTTPIDAILTTDEIASEIKCSPDTVSRVARKTHEEGSSIPPIGRQIGGVWVFTRANANKLAQLIQRRVGRPEKE